jgi:hypothetical protein
MKMEQTECSEVLAYKIQMPENYPEESIQHSEHSKSVKSKNVVKFFEMFTCPTCKQHEVTNRRLYFLAAPLYNDRP